MREALAPELLFAVALVLAEAELAEFAPLDEVLPFASAGARLLEEPLEDEAVDDDDVEVDRCSVLGAIVTAFVKVLSATLLELDTLVS